MACSKDLTQNTNLPLGSGLDLYCWEALVAIDRPQLPVLPARQPGQYMQRMYVEVNAQLK